MWATGWTSAGVALIAWQAGGTDWAGRYAAVALFAWANWVLLAQVLLGLVERRWSRFILAIAGKVVNFAWFVGLYLPWVEAKPGSLLAGVNTFFFVVFLKILGLKIRERNSFGSSRTTPPTGTQNSQAGPWS